MTEEKTNRVQKEHDKGHRETLQSLKDTDLALEHAQKVISEARIRLQNATKRYQERLDGLTTFEPN